jgi:hypothetical protein
MDPIGLFFTNSFKRGAMNSRNEIILKLEEYIRNPNEIVFLGDSKIDNLIKNKLEKDNKLRISNLAFGGSNIHEIEETFNFLVKYNNPKRLYIGTNFHNYNMAFSHNRVKRLSKYIEKPFYYLFSKDLFYQTIDILKDNFIPKSTDINNQIRIEDLDPEKKWKGSLETINSFFNYYLYPEEIEAKLLMIKKFCEEHKIELIFIISPVHKDIITKINDYDLEEKYKRFKNFIFSLGTVYDFSNLNEFTIERLNFNDPYHLNKDACLILFDEIINPNSNYILKQKFTDVKK